MCDRYSYTHGYICDECFDELVNLGLTADISVFMDSDRTDRPPDLIELAETRFNLEFPER